jgi:G:T/U-mismatch repair DNA glycosylase
MKIKVLPQNDIGLWDVYKTRKKGSLDIHIKNPQENDFKCYLPILKKINKIVFNGKESHKFF